MTRTTRAWLLLAIAASVPLAAAPAKQVFRSSARAVTVNASVMRNQVPVQNLTAKDFVVLDNGVPQTVETVEFEGVPIDATLILDNSGSTHWLVEDLKRNVADIAALLRPDDQFRVLAFGYQVVDLTGWQRAGAKPNIGNVEQARGSLVYDSILLALLHRPEPGRRHMVVAMTDAIDVGSTTRVGALAEVAKRAEGVLNLILVDAKGSLEPHAPKQWMPIIGGMGGPAMARIAESTGGDSYTHAFGRDFVVSAFKKAFEQFRLSYVLSYTPTGVSSSGWHALDVKTPNQKGAAIRARQGYWASQDLSAAPTAK